VALPDDYVNDALLHIAAQRRRPRQSILRRAVSAAYYAIFSELATDVARASAPGTPARLQTAVQRKVQHALVLRACKGWRQQQPWADVIGGPVPAELLVLAADVMALQQARHEADYDPDARLSKANARALVLRARSALATWRALRANHADAANVFLVSLMHTTPRE
jgi:hypothetical protein